MSIETQHSQNTPPCHHRADVRSSMPPAWGSPKTRLAHPFRTRLRSWVHWPASNFSCLILLFIMFLIVCEIDVCFLFGCLCFWVWTKAWFRTAFFASVASQSCSGSMQSSQSCSASRRSSAERIIGMLKSGLDVVIDMKTECCCEKNTTNKLN